MIIAAGLKRLFAGMTADIVEVDGAKTKTIKFGYGDQKELNAWIADQNKKTTPDKYPLVWYIINSYTEFNGEYTTNATLAIMNATKIDKMNDWRNANSYSGVLNPVFKAIEYKLMSNPYVQIEGELPNKFEQFDEPNYGVDRNSPNNDANDFTRKAATGEKNLLIDVVDVKFVRFKMKIKADCIN